MREDTIAAIATAPGEGGIGIVRISGEKAFEILKKIFIPASSEIKNRMLTYGHIADPDSGSTIDEVMAVYMKGPRSYTAEDVAEIQCHGSMISLKKILELTFRNGARPAEKGEFTKRAFLNGRLDLSQAEAVIDLIRAKSDKTFDVALSQLEGLFSEKIKDIRADLVDILVLITVNIDYPDEDIEEIASDVFLVIWRNKEKLDINKEIAPYIAGITKKLILKRKNNIKNNNENIEEYENLLYEKNNDIHIKIEENEKINILTNELTKMKEEDKNIFTYYYYQSKSIKDISSLLKISQIIVKSRLSRIRKKLKNELEKRGYGYERR